MANPVGFAAQGTGCTGGAGGREVTVSTGLQLQAAIDSVSATPGPLIVRVDGTVTPANGPANGQIDVKGRSAITVVGVADRGELNGIGINIANASSNIIVQNLKIHHVLNATGQGDCISIQGASHHIWVNRCELWNEYDNEPNKDKYDGLLDIKSGSEYITVSYNYFHDHHKGALIGSSDTDTGNRYITYHANRFRRIYSRLPLWRFGRGHFFNNLVDDIPGSGTNIRMGAVVRVENNHYRNVKNPVLSVDSSQIGYWDTRGNLEEGCTYTAVGAGEAVSSPGMPATGTYDPPYAYTAMPASEVAAHVTAHAGVDKPEPAAPQPGAIRSSIAASSRVSAAFAGAAAAPPPPPQGTRVAFEPIPLGTGTWRPGDPTSAPPATKPDGTVFNQRDAFARINAALSDLDARVAALEAAGAGGAT